MNLNMEKIDSFEISISNVKSTSIKVNKIRLRSDASVVYACKYHVIISEITIRRN